MIWLHRTESKSRRSNNLKKFKAFPPGQPFSIQGPPPPQSVEVVGSRSTRIKCGSFGIMSLPPGVPFSDLSRLSIADQIGCESTESAASRRSSSAGLEQTAVRPHSCSAGNRLTVLGQPPIPSSSLLYKKTKHRASSSLSHLQPGTAEW